MYRLFFKRLCDFILSLLALVILSPLLLFLMIVGTVAMKGNPFFCQKRIGLHEKEFKLIKFRSMSNAKDEDGNLLPNDKRLIKYGRILRSSSLDELPELINILKGDMSIVGPRPLLVEYLPYYSKEEHHRHDVRPGLTGLAQVNGRNSIASWEERFAYDLKYINNCSFLLDVKVILGTIGKVLKHSDVLQASQARVGRLDEERAIQKMRNKK